MQLGSIKFDASHKKVQQKLIIRDDRVIPEAVGVAVTSSSIKWMARGLSMTSPSTQRDLAVLELDLPQDCLFQLLDGLIPRLADYDR